MKVKKILQNYKTGKLVVIDVPPPALKPGYVLVRKMASLVSVGTERHMLEMAKKSLISKALARPDLVCQVIAKARAGIVIEPDAAQLAEAMIELLDNPKLREEMGNNGRRLVMERFTWDKIADQMIGLYQRILKGEV